VRILLELASYASLYLHSLVIMSTFVARSLIHLSLSRSYSFSVVSTPPRLLDFRKFPIFDAFLKPHFDVGHMGRGQGTGNRFRPNHLSWGQGTAELTKWYSICRGHENLSKNSNSASTIRLLKHHTSLLVNYFLTICSQRPYPGSLPLLLGVF